MNTPVAEKSMGKERKNTPVRIADDAINAARIASGYTGESMADYISRVVKERAEDDARRLHAERFGGGPKAEGKGPKGKAGGREGKD